MLIFKKIRPTIFLLNLELAHQNFRCDEKGLHNKLQDLGKSSGIKSKCQCERSCCTVWMSSCGHASLRNLSKVLRTSIIAWNSRGAKTSTGIQFCFLSFIGVGVNPGPGLKYCSKRGTVAFLLQGAFFC